MTEKIYQTDAYCREATARIVGSERRDGRFFVRLERTIFCPAGGGQPADAGTINGRPLLDLASENDDILHVLDSEPGSGQALLQLDFPRRYDHMQQHTAQHLLSQVLLILFNAPTLSFAIGPEHASIEIGRPALAEPEIVMLENECAGWIFAALPVRVFESEDGAALQLRKPSKRQGPIRVVEIAGLDRSACGGTHLRSSAEIGLLKIIGSERIRGNIRLYYAAGYRALRDYQLKHAVSRDLQHAINIPLSEMPSRLAALLDERDSLRRDLKKMQRREMEKEIAVAAAGPATLVVREFSGVDGVDLRFFVLALTKFGKDVLAFDRDGEKHVVIGRGQGDCDLRRFSAEIFALLQGKGGGRENLLEGRGGSFAKLPAVVALLQAGLGADESRPCK